jgi:Rad3-related DNA helicase
MTNLSYWPFESPPRANQIKALEWLEKQDARYLILESPVGSGKSNIGIAYQQYLAQTATPRYEDDKGFGKSYILTPQRILQAQYEESFKDNQKVNLASFYGKANYTCREKNTTCDVGSVVKPQCTGCPFVAAKRRAVMATNTVLNYKLALLQFAYGQKTFTKRSLIVMDECHTLENHLIDFDALKITDWRCKKYNIRFELQKTLPNALQWMADIYLPKMREVLTKLERECEEIQFRAEDGEKLTKAEIKKLQEFDALSDHVDEVSLMASRDIEYVEDNYVLVHEPLTFQFKRLYGAYTFTRLVKPKADKFLFMSSTVLNQKGFCKDLGILPEESAFLSLDSDFPKENRPVYYIPSMKMNAGWNAPELTKERRAMADGIIKIVESHKDDTGIIHTGNFKIAEWLVRELKNYGISHHIYHHNPDSGDDRNSIIEAFTTDVKPRILISPSSTEGLDLKEDLGRFAIFAKVPFGNLGDQWIKRRMELSSEWYQRQALINIIQGGGRVVRSKEDWGHVYILDQSFAFLYKMTYMQIPQWWRDAYKAV